MCLTRRPKLVVVRGDIWVYVSLCSKSIFEPEGIRQTMCVYVWMSKKATRGGNIMILFYALYPIMHSCSHTVIRSSILLPFQPLRTQFLHPPLFPLLLLQTFLRPSFGPFLFNRGRFHQCNYLPIFNLVRSSARPLGAHSFMAMSMSMSMPNIFEICVIHRWSSRPALTYLSYSLDFGPI